MCHVKWRDLKSTIEKKTVASVSHQIQRKFDQISTTWLPAYMSIALSATRQEMMK
jgi:hypothetical protein